MWKPFKYNMRLVTFLLLVQMGYIIAKAIENPLLCNDSPENDLRLKRSDEKEIHFDSEDTTGKDPKDDVTRKMFSKSNNDNDNDHDTTDNDDENSNEFASNSNTLPQKLPLVNSITKSPVNVDERGIITDRLTGIKNAPLEEPVYYKAIDPKYIIISGLSLPKTTKNITNVSKSEGPLNTDLKRTKTTPLDYSNLTKAMNVSNGDTANDIKRKEVVKNEADTDVSNIRELREHLLDHLLDYFLNIIKEENYIHNDTRKKNGKDRMKVEQKLRNYYDPQHLDTLFDDDDYYDTNLAPSDYHGDNDSEEDLLDNVNQNKAVNKENITNIHLLRLEDEVDKNAAEAHTSPEDLQKEAMSLEQNLNKSSPDGKSFNVNISEPVTSKYVNLIEKENDFTNALLNTTEKSEDAFDTNVNVRTTTERSILNAALNDKAAEVDTDLLNYSEEAVTDGIVYDNGALTIDEYTSFEDYIDSDVFEVIKNVTVHENDINPIAITTENIRRKIELDKEIYVANGTINETYANASKDDGKKDTHTGKKDKPNNLAIQDPSNKNDNDNTPCDEDNLAENKNKSSLKRSKQAVSIIFTNQIESRSFNKTHDLEKDQQYDIITAPVNKRSDKAKSTDGNNNVLMKKIYCHLDHRSDTNAECRNNILSKNKYDHNYIHKANEEADSDKSQAEQQSDDNLKTNATITSNIIELRYSDNRKHFSNEGTCSEETNEMNSIKRKLVAEVMAQTIAIEKVKQEGETKLEPNDESSQNCLEKDKHPTVKPVRYQKQLTVKPPYTTQATRETQIIPKITHKRFIEVENKIFKTKHCDCKNHRSFEKISREHDVYKLKRRDAFKTASKLNNKKYNIKKNNMKIKHRYNNSHRAFKTQPQENGQYKLKHRDIEKPVLSNTISVENDIYVRKHIDDFATIDKTVTDNYERKHIDDSATVEEPVSKQVNPKYKPTFSKHFQKKRQRDKKIRKVRNTDKTKHKSKTKKHNSEKVIPNQDEFKPTLKEDRHSVFETHTDIIKGDNEINANSGDTLNPSDADTPTIENQDEKETLESYEELLKQNDLLDKLKLPFYVSSTTKRVEKEKFKEHPKKLVARKDEKETDILLNDHNTVLKGNSDLINQNIDINTTISRLASSKILDFITDKLAGQMLKKLEKSLASKNHLITKEMNPGKVEQIDILFEKDGKMVIVGREHVKEEDENGSEKHFTRNKRAHAY